MTKPIQELEFFKDNAKILKYEHQKFEKALKVEGEANEQLEEFIPKLEATADSLNAV